MQPRQPSSNRADRLLRANGLCPRIMDEVPRPCSRRRRTDRHRFPYMISGREVVRNALRVSGRVYNQLLFTRDV
jgi:hypothetical protein